MIFLTLDEVLSIHHDVIERDGGLHGIRDSGLLISAIEMPKSNMFGEYLHKTVFDMAAAYIFHIVCNHAFLDGNKRTGTASCLIFLGLNGVDVTKYNDDSIEEMAIKVATGKLNKEQISKFLEQ